MLKRISSTIFILLSFSLTLSAQTSWTQKANFPGGQRAFTSAFTIGHYAFVGMGYNGNYLYDFYKWNETTNTWSSIPNYPGAGSYDATAFTIEGKGYVCLGLNGSGTTTDIWRYDTITNTWAQMATFPGIERYDCEAFVIGHKAYLIAGSISGPPYLQDVWVYDAHQNTWTQKANWPGGLVEEVICFAIGNHGYVGDGWYPGCIQQMFKYDTTNDSWTSIAAPPPATGITEQPDTWVAGSKAYVCTGGNCNAAGLRYGWMYDTVTKSWCEFNDISASKLSRGNGVVFTINNHGYFCTGQDTNLNYLDDLWEYTPSTKIKVSDTNLCVNDSVSFSDSTTYIASAWNWSFPGGKPSSSNSQNPKVYYSHAGTYTATLVLNTCGGNDTVTKTITATGLANISIKGKSSICLGSSDTLFASGGGSYLWSNGATTSAIIVKPFIDTTFSITVSNNGCSKDTSIVVTVNKLTATITSPLVICQGDTVTLDASGGGSYLWSTGASTSGISIAPSSTTTYSVTIHNGACLKDTSVTVTVNPSPNANITGNNQVCKGDSTLLTATGGGTYMWSTNETSDSIVVAPSSNSVYTVVVKNSFGCKTDAVFQVNVASPIDSIIGPSILCLGDSITLSAIGGNYFQWNTGATTSSIEISSTNNMTYYVTNTCHDTAKKRISMDNDIYSLYACCDTTINLPGIPVVLNASGSILYYWLPPTEVSCDSCPNPTVTPTTTTTYTVIGIDSAGCRYAKTITIDVRSCLAFSIPNVFTPNGDGINDEFYIIDAHAVSNYSIVIYDRWGKMMYQSNNPDVYWNGRNQNNNSPVSDGVYYYIIKYSCNDKSYNKDGYIQVIR